MTNMTSISKLNKSQLNFESETESLKQKTIAHICTYISHIVPVCSSCQSHSKIWSFSTSNTYFRYRTRKV